MEDAVIVYPNICSGLLAFGADLNSSDPKLLQDIIFSICIPIPDL